MKEVALKTINYKTIDTNSSAFFFFCERFLNVSPISSNYEVSVKSCFFNVDTLNSYIYIIPLKMTIYFLYVSCSSIPPSPTPDGGQQEFRGEGGGNFRGVGGLLTEVFFQGV